MKVLSVVGVAARVSRKLPVCSVSSRTLLARLIAATLVCGLTVLTAALPAGAATSRSEQATMRLTEASSNSQVQWHWWGYSWSANRLETAALRDLQNENANNWESWKDAVEHSFPPGVADELALVFGVGSLAYRDMADTAAAIYNRGNCMTLNWTWSTVWWADEVPYGTGVCQ